MIDCGLQSATDSASVAPAGWWTAWRRWRGCCTRTWSASACRRAPCASSRSAAASAAGSRRCRACLSHTRDRRLGVASQGGGAAAFAPDALAPGCIWRAQPRGTQMHFHWAPPYLVAGAAVLPAGHFLLLAALLERILLVVSWRCVEISDKFRCLGPLHLHVYIYWFARGQLLQLVGTEVH